MLHISLILRLCTVENVTRNSSFTLKMGSFLSQNYVLLRIVKVGLLTILRPSLNVVSFKELQLKIFQDMTLLERTIID